jgi:hypothetical protein
MSIGGGESKGLLQLIAEASESEPQESEKLRKSELLERAVSASATGGTVNTVLKSSSSKLTKEAKCELAVIAVKRAFSQCPNLSLLVSACLVLPCLVLSSPVFLSYLVCHALECILPPPGLDCIMLTQGCIQPWIRF